MTHAEIVECTRWTWREVCNLIDVLRSRGVVRLVEWRRDRLGRRRVYGLAGGAQ